ncbi:hypothetical protein NLI96_g11843 [Meripilus lineatus]|uniref:Uncharacterized protein n=1 Tax=Meripilus lineatus TaxID=2056292 RepID=A0AAD5UTI5_9APHY|nr:hypothetical protein NLI96_g11843 [Physisporinus lineatus]
MSKKSDEQPLAAVWTVTDGIITSPAHSLLPPVPIRDRSFADIGEELHRQPELDASFERRWIKDDYFWTAFAPEVMECTGCFQSLSVTKNSIPIDTNKNSFVLRSSILQEWITIEDSLIRTVDALKSSYKPHMPLYTRAPNPPSWYGYQRVFGSYREAKNSIWASRSAFLGLMTYTSYLIGTSIARDTVESAFSIPRWAGVLVHDYKAPYSWINGLNNSWIADFDERTGVRRLGGFVNTSIAQWQWPACILKTFVRLRIPLWFWFPSTDISSTPRIYIPFFQHPSNSHQQPSPESADATISDRLPSERWEEFFAKRVAANAVREQSESPSDRQKRLNRLGHSLLNGHPVCPGKKGARVYEWEESLANPGVYRRVSVPRTAVQDKWEQYTDAQKRYDAYFNEWDLFPGADNPQNAMSTEEEYDEIIPIPVDLPSRVQRDTWTHTGSWNEIKLDFKDDDIVFDNLLSILTSRYGLLRTANPVLPEDAKSFSRVKFYLGYPSDNVDDVDQNRARALIASLMSPNIPSRELFDLSASRMTDLSTVDLASGYLNHNTPVYQLFPSQKLATTNVIVVHDAVDAMHFLRRTEWHSSPPFALQQLVSRGIPFTHLHLPPSQPAPILVLRSDVLLGWQGNGNNGSAADYQQYVRIRAVLLNNKAVVRAGLGSGGIIWRLIIDEVNIEDIFAAPDANALCYATHVDYADFGYMMFTLSDNDREIIAGVYHMPTGKLILSIHHQLFIRFHSNSQPRDNEVLVAASSRVAKEWLLGRILDSVMRGVVPKAAAGHIRRQGYPADGRAVGENS